MKRLLPVALLMVLLGGCTVAVPPPPDSTHPASLDAAEGPAFTPQDLRADEDRTPVHEENSNNGGQHHAH